MPNTTIAFNLSLMPNEKILQTVYLADHGKNMEILNALMQGNDAINKFLPDHFRKLRLSCLKVCTLLSSPDMHAFLLESDVRAGFPFLMLDCVPDEGTTISNCMNYADEHVSALEASMVANVLAYSYMCEQSSNEDEQYFAAFMVEFIKDLASHNYEMPNFNSSAFYRIID